MDYINILISLKMGNQPTTSSQPTTLSQHIKTVKFQFDIVEPTKLTSKNIYCVKEDHMLIFANYDSSHKNVSILRLLKFPPEMSSTYYEKISEAVKNDKSIMIWYRPESPIIYCVEIDGHVYSASNGIGFMTGSSFTKI